MNEQEFVFSLAELQPDCPLRYDVYRLDGALLARRGEAVSADMLRAWDTQGLTQAKVLAPHVERALTGQANIQQASQLGPPDETAKKPASHESSQTDPQLLQPYDQHMLRRLDARFSQSSASLMRLAGQLEQHGQLDEGVLENHVHEFVKEIELDLAAVLANVQSQIWMSITSRDMQLAARSARLAVLSAAIGSALGFSAEQCSGIGMAGMLHDLALYDAAQPEVLRVFGPSADQQQAFWRHPQQAADLLASASGINDTVRHVMSQVHEQPDGDGFPRGLPSNRIHRWAKLLHVVDAYLTLISAAQPEPLPAARRLVPADAVAYLLHHARHGHFDVAMVQGFVQALSLYPIGSRVELDDQTSATVMRSIAGFPAQPIVKLDGPHATILDLRYCDARIERPLPSSSSNAGRLPAAEIDKVWWR